MHTNFNDSYITENGECNIICTKYAFKLVYKKFILKILNQTRPNYRKFTEVTLKTTALTQIFRVSIKLEEDFR